jgi:hypothetical protein
MLITLHLIFMLNYITPHVDVDNLHCPHYSVSSCPGSIMNTALAAMLSPADTRAHAHLSVLLNVLPALSADAAVAPYAAKAIAPLGAEGSPVLLRCLYMRLVVEGWLLTGDNDIKA